MVLDENGEISETLVLPDWAAKMGSGGLLPLAPKVRDALANLRSAYPNAEPCDPLFVSQKTRKALTRQAIVDGMRRIWRQAGIDASSHSGRRYFITQAARHISLCGGSLEDVRSLARHTALSTTQLYIAQNTKAQRDVVALVGKMLRVA
jgi:integrase/recombinase XerD